MLQHGCRVLGVLGCVATILLTAIALGENTGWRQAAGFELLFNQGYYSQNWQGDEKTSGSLTAGFGHTAAKQLAAPVRFEHEAALAFGQQLTREEADGDATWVASKSEDKIRLDEILRFTLGAWVDPLVSAQLKSQFYEEWADTTSGDTSLLWLNPLQFLETAGVGRRFYDDSTRKLTSEFGLAARQLIDRTQEEMLADAGVGWTTAFKTLVGTPNATYSTRLVVYKPFVMLGGTGEVGDLPEVDWEHTLSARFTKVLSGKLYFQMLWDEKDPVNRNPRFKQTLGMGLSLAWPAEG